MTKNRTILKLSDCYYFDPNYDFFINFRPEMPRILPKTSKQSLPAFTPSISGKTRSDGEKWLRYLESASINYPGTDTLVLAFFLAETCVRDNISSKILWISISESNCVKSYSHICSIANFFSDTLFLRFYYFYFMSLL